jgi:CRP/FNR family transcriptional regulator, polysaccharide utilization system transcription regulator
MGNPSYILSMCENTLNMFQHSIFNFISLAHNQVNGRIANVLLYLWEHVYRDSGFDFTLSRKELAQFAACSHENVITTLSKFNKEGFIELEGKKIIIKDMAGLSEISKRG